MKVPVYNFHFQELLHTPLALGSLISYVRHYKEGVLLRHFQFFSEFHGGVSTLKRSIKKNGPGIFLFSDYIWNQKQHLLVSRYIKAKYKNAICIHGGPSVPRDKKQCKEFLEKYPFIDIAILGESEITFAETLEKLALSTANDFNLSDVLGLAYRDRTTGQIHINGERPPPRELETFPSPYVTGLFEQDHNKWIGAVIETSRGCPYQCSYCDWGAATFQRIRQFPLERVKQEIQWVATHKISTLMLTDSNFGMFARDVEITKFIAECRQQYGYPLVVHVYYAKNGQERIAEIVRLFNSAGIAAEAVASLQTTDAQTLSNINRSNIKMSHMENLIDLYQKQGLSVGCELMMGLPGATVDSLKRDLQFCFDRRLAVNAFATQVLPNTPMAAESYREKYKIELDKDDFVMSCYSFSNQDYHKMHDILRMYCAFISFGILKYFLFHLQKEYGIGALQFIEDFLEHNNTNKKNKESLRLITIFRKMIGVQRLTRLRYSSRLLFTNWENLHKEILSFCKEKYNLTPNPELNLIATVQSSILPVFFKKLPLTLQLDHDLAEYYRAGLSSPKPLHQYGSSSLTITDPFNLCRLPLELTIPYNIFQVTFELNSKLQMQPDAAKDMHRFLFLPSKLNLMAALPGWKRLVSILLGKIYRKLDLASITLPGR